MGSSGNSKTLSSAFDSPTFGEDSSFHVDQPVGSMSISPCGRDVVLASKEGLHIIDLDSPWSLPRYLPHHTSWEVADVQWSPFAARDYWVVSTSNQKALVWNLATKTSQDSVEHVLHAHSRAITDINFSAHNPDCLATCAVDSFVHCWDLRTPARPVISFSDWFAGATQVKWNRQDSHVIASAHDRHLRIWDERKGAYPLRSIEAHDTKIYGIDWNRIQPTNLITCSLDKSIKFWDYMKLEDEPERVIQTPFPVWRARHTPFGRGLLAMPQRDSNDLHLYSRRAGDWTEGDCNASPVHKFEGHKGQVKEFLWRPRGTITDGTDHREFQLVSWGADKELRLHRVMPQVTAKIGFERGKSFTPTLKLTRKNAKYRTFRDEVLEDDHQGTSISQPEFPLAPGQSFSARSRGSLSVGMSKVSIPHVRGWIQSTHATSSRVGMHGRNTNRPDLNPITWMRGVKIAGWDNIETLGDEITYVGERFTKVKFEVADVQRRRATVSLHGPWGSDNSSLFVKLDIKFPHEYPRAAIPIFHIQKTVSMTDTLAIKICSELQTIARTYKTANRGSLEAILLYLLGERTVEDSLALIPDVADHEGKIASRGNDLEGDVSSDEDDEVVGTFQQQEMDLSTSELLRPVNANVNVPVAKACGALWADNGRLVCFFSPKADKLVSVFGSLGLKELDRTSRSDKIFEGFGRLQAASPGPRKTVGTITTLDDGASDDSDDSLSTSSSSSGSSDILTSLPNRFQSQGFRHRNFGLQRSHSTDHSQRSNTAVSMLKSASDVHQNVISIHNFEDLLPSKRSLAKQYRIFGNGPEICAHNADVAAKHGDQDLTQVWNLLKLVLYNEVPLEDVSLPRSNHDIVVIAQQALNTLKRKDSGIDLSFDAKEVAPKVTKAGRVRWGESPLGGRWLIPALFQHFERLADVQMLAMLSCIFNEPRAAEDAYAKGAHQTEHNKPLQLKSPAFSIDYYPSPAVARSLLQVKSSFNSTSRLLHAPMGTHGSAGSSNDLWTSDSTTPFSTGTTPPFTSKFHRMSSDRESQARSMSVSPEQRFSRRSNSNLATAFAASISRPFNLATSASSSPPTNYIKRRNSPSESFVNAPPQGVSGWNNVVNKAATVPEHLTQVTVHSFSESDTEDRAPHRRPTKIQVSLKNQKRFDKDGYASTPLLDPKLDWQYKAYRAAYAHLLLIWELPFERCEVLKFDGLPLYFGTKDSGPNHHPPGESLLSLGNKRKGSKTAQAIRGLDMQRHCAGCGIVLPRLKSGMASECRQCNRPPTRMPCAVCSKSILGLYVPCLNCKHATHFNCHSLWFSSSSDDESGEESKEREQPKLECASGCGCTCSEYLVVDVPMPESPRTSHTPLAGDGNGRLGAETAVESQVGWDDSEDPWERASFSALARGIGRGLSRGLTSKASDATVQRSSGLGRAGTL